MLGPGLCVCVAPSGYRRPRPREDCRCSEPQPKDEEQGGDDGSQRTFRAGDTFVSPAGSTGTWEIVEPAKKLYAYYE